MIPRLALVLLLGVLGLAGCATMSAEERAQFCARVNWEDYGRNDGKLGVPARERLKLMRQCAEAGFKPDQDAYLRGHAEGLKEYCTAERGYEVGAAGGHYRHVCPPDDEVAFLQGFREGRRAWRRNNPSISLGFGAGFGHSFWGFGYYPWW